MRHTSSWLARGFGCLAKIAKCLRKSDAWSQQATRYEKTSEETHTMSQDPNKKIKKTKMFGNKGTLPKRLAPTCLPLLLLSLCCNACAACAADSPKLFGISPNELAGCFQDFPPWPLNLSLGIKFRGFVEEGALVAYMAPWAPCRLGSAPSHDVFAPAAVSVGWHADSLRRSSHAVVLAFLHKLGLGSTILCLFWLLNQRTPRKQKRKKERNKFFSKGRLKTGIVTGRVQG